MSVPYACSCFAPALQNAEQLVAELGLTLAYWQAAVAEREGLARSVQRAAARVQSEVSPQQEALPLPAPPVAATDTSPGACLMLCCSSSGRAHSHPCSWHHSVLLQLPAKVS
jgi:hypothetical protein